MKLGVTWGVDILRAKKNTKIRIEIIAIRLSKWNLMEKIFCFIAHKVYSHKKIPFKNILRQKFTATAFPLRSENEKITTPFER